MPVPGRTIPPSRRAGLVPMAGRGDRMGDRHVAEDFTSVTEDFG